MLCHIFIEKKCHARFISIPEIHIIFVHFLEKNQKLEKNLLLVDNKGLFNMINMRSLLLH